MRVQWIIWQQVSNRKQADSMLTDSGFYSIWLKIKWVLNTNLSVNVSGVMVNQRSISLSLSRRKILFKRICRHERTNGRACARPLFRCHRLVFIESISRFNVYTWHKKYSFSVFFDRCRVIEMYGINIIKFVVNERRQKQNKYTKKRHTQRERENIALMYWGEIILLNSIASKSMKPNT